MEAEHEAFGFPFPPMKDRLRIFQEQIEAVRGFWGDGPRPHLIVGGSGLSARAGRRDVRRRVQHGHGDARGVLRAPREARARLQA